LDKAQMQTDAAPMSDHMQMDAVQASARDGAFNTRPAVKPDRNRQGYLGGQELDTQGRI